MNDCANRTERESMNYIKVKKSEDNPESAEVLASAIVEISKGFEKLLSTKLNQTAIIQLLMGMPGMSSNISKGQIKLVLNNLKRLRGWYIK